MANKFTHFIKSVPPCTLFFITLCIVIYVIQLFFGGVNACAISAYFVIDKLQIYVLSVKFAHD